MDFDLPNQNESIDEIFQGMMENHETLYIPGIENNLRPYFNEWSVNGSQNMAEGTEKRIADLFEIQYLYYKCKKYVDDYAQGLEVFNKKYEELKSTIDKEVQKLMPGLYMKMPKSYSDSLDHKEIKNQLEENGSAVDVPQSETEILSNKLDNELEHLAAFMPSGIEMTKKFQEEDPETWNCHESD